MSTQSPVSRAIVTQGKWKRYLLGYIAAVHYKSERASHEIALTKTGHWCSMWPKDKTEDVHYWPTKAQAMEVARKADSPDCPAYVRPWAYETAIPEHAKGLAPLETAEEMEWVRPEANPYNEHPHA